MVGGRLTVIGGGVMELMAAYYAAPLADAVTVLERSRVGDPATASFGLTRSVRNDYRDPAYARLAFEARQLWRELERESGERLIIDCGCLNLVKDSVTPDLDRTYAVQSYEVLEQLRLRREAFTRAQLRERFPQFDADGTVYDIGRFTPARFAGSAPVTGMAS
jgi:glycine/D-amino acid oxidase-like deaminating enzyme